ncbi:small terminase protein, partial [uncultured Caudovirales phage]
EDYRLARKTFRQLINKGNDAIEGISDLAKESESPRAYEVMATLMKTVADTTKDLFELQKKNKDLQKDDKKRPQDEERLNIERAVFVGSTADLLKQIKLEKKE